MTTKLALIVLALVVFSGTVEARSRHHHSYRVSHRKSKATKPILETGKLPNTVAALTPETIREWALKKYKID